MEENEAWECNEENGINDVWDSAMPDLRCQHFKQGKQLLQEPWKERMFIKKIWCGWSRMSEGMGLGKKNVKVISFMFVGLGQIVYNWPWNNLNLKGVGPVICGFLAMKFIPSMLGSPAFPSTSFTSSISATPGTAIPTLLLPPPQPI